MKLWTHIVLVILGIGWLLVLVAAILFMIVMHYGYFTDGPEEKNNTIFYLIGSGAIFGASLFWYGAYRLLWRFGKTE